MAGKPGWRETQLRQRQVTKCCSKGGVRASAGSRDPWEETVPSWNGELWPSSLREARLMSRGRVRGEVRAGRTGHGWGGAHQQERI